MAKAQTSTSRSYELDPLLWLWRLFVSVRFALALIFFLIIASLLGVLIPQVPAQMRDNPAGLAAWFEFQRQSFGVYTEPMRQLGLFDVFRSLWFVSGLGLLVVSVSVCTINRFAPIWRNVTRPQMRVPDNYFERGQPVTVVEAADIGALTIELRRRHYRVVTKADGQSTYVFADRFPWAQFATFVSHLALILFLAGGLVTVLTARDQDILIGEGETRPAFGLGDPDHMQIYVEDAVGRFDATGFPLDYRSSIVVYKDGAEVARGVTTVNDPLKYKGFKFHQTAYFPDGAALRVRDVTSGRLVYDEVLALTDLTPAPRILVQRGGSVILEETLMPTDVISGVAGTIVTIPGTAGAFWMGVQPARGNEGPELVIFQTAGAQGTRGVLREGAALDLDGQTSVTFVGQTGVSSLTRRDIPGAGPESMVELSAGTTDRFLVLSPVQGNALALSANQSIVVGGYEYTFLGQREFTGITVRRDRGSILIWVATGLLLLGLALTFYTPRRRLWGKVAGGQAVFRGLGGRQSAIESELKLIALRANHR